MQDALLSYERGLALDPNSTAFTFNKANTLRDLGRLEEAIAAYDRVLQREPQHLGALTIAAALSLRMRRFEHALADTTAQRRCIRLTPSDTTAAGTRLSAWDGTPKRSPLMNGHSP